MLVARLKSVPDMERSASKVPCRACARLDRSRKLRRYIRIKKGRRWRSILRRRAFWVRACHSGGAEENWVVHGSWVLWGWDLVAERGRSSISCFEGSMLVLGLGLWWWPVVGFSVEVMVREMMREKKGGR